MRKIFESCSVVVLVLCISGQALAAPITHQLVVNPIQVCDDTGGNCANPGNILYEAETDKIWDQSGVDISFLSWKQMDNTAAQNITATSNLLVAGNQALGGNIINMWFVESYAGSYGAANSSGRRVAIGNNVFSYSSGAGRRDTIAHELGHILGLPHISGTYPLNVMESGGVRNAATAIGQIIPDGALKGQLTTAQVTTALGSSYLEAIPEPSACTLGIAGLLGMSFYTRRRRPISRRGELLPSQSRRHADRWPSALSA